MELDEYNYLRECDLEAALVESRNDIKNNNCKTGSVEDHIKRIDDARNKS